MKDLIRSFIPLKSNKDRLQLLSENILKSINDPTNGNAVGLVGDLANMNSLVYVRNKMLSSSTGKRILIDKPRIRQSSFNFDELKNYDKNTLGFAYYKFMNNYNFTPEERPITTYYTDIELAYILQRYKEIHDFIHTILGYGIALHDELAVKVFECIQMKLPSAALASIGGTISLLNFEEFSVYFNKYIPHIYKVALNSEFIMNIYFEEELSSNINDFRKRFGYETIEEFRI